MSYEMLLDAFFGGHNPTSDRSSQYASIIFFHNDVQKAAAQRAMAAMGAWHVSC